MLKAKLNTDIINLDIGAKILGGDITEAKNVLTMFINDQLLDDEIGIIQAYANKNYKQLAKFVHDLYGAVCFCSAPALKIAAEALDRALCLTHKDIDFLYKNLVNEINRLKAEFKKIES